MVTELRSFADAQDDKIDRFRHHPLVILIPHSGRKISSFSFQSSVLHK